MQSAYEPAPQVSPSYRFATRELLPATLQATYPGKADRYEWWEAFWRRVCRVLPLLHHAPWAKHVGKGQGKENHDPRCGTGRVQSGPSRRGWEVRDFL